MVLSTPQQAVNWLRQKVASGHLSVDSRLIAPHHGFIAWPGAAVDGRQFVSELLSQQVGACLVEAHGAQAWSWVNDERVALYPDLKNAIATIAALYYAEPSKQLDVVAVTGTNGKTSTSWWLAQALTALSYPCGVIGTMGVGTFDQLEPATLTTPDPIRLQQSLRTMVDRKVKACAIEASSIGIAEHRFDDVCVKVALLTNVTQDHLDYHKTMQAYWEAKRKLFSWPQLQAVVINVDDAYGAELVKELRAQNDGKTIITYAQQSNADASLQAVKLEHVAGGISFEVHEGQEQVKVQIPLIGDYNVSNVLGVIGALRALGYSLQEAAIACRSLVPVAGRMQSVFALRSDVCKVVVDYAHTPDALANVLQALAPLAQARQGKLWCVFGCGGDRDASKRPVMGAVAQKQAQGVVVTSDNPRNEDSIKIIQQITAGMSLGSGVHVEADRRKAIAWAIAHADEKDVVLIAGKGHETYQEIKGVRYPFSDADVASQILNAYDKSDQKKNNAMNEQVMTLQQAQELLQSQGIVARIYGDGNAAFSRVHTDTRTLQTGDLFVALRGDNFDAHDFLAQAKAQGAVAALAEHGLVPAGLAGLEVADSLKALGALARGWRACHALPVIAVTGSNGKTTTTQMIASILNAWQGSAALATQGNFNNAIGVPLTVLRLRPEHQVAVVELGMNHLGEIAYLARIAQPTIALVNNAQREHLEFMSTVEAVAKENGQVISALPQDGVAVFPADDAFTAKWHKMSQGRTSLTFALDELQADYTVAALWDKEAWQLNIHTPQGQVECRLHSAGLQNVKNALAATACAQQAGAPLEATAKGLNAFVPVKGRSQVELLQIGAHQLTLINDTYNANPDSVLAAIEVLAALPGPTLLVLGEMGEMGLQGKEFHREVGTYAHQKGIAALWGTGEMVRETVAAMGIKGRFFEEVNGLSEALIEQAPQYASVLVKGSRYMQMERVVEHLKNANQGGRTHVA